MKKIILISIICTISYAEVYELTITGYAHKNYPISTKICGDKKIIYFLNQYIKRKNNKHTIKKLKECSTSNKTKIVIKDGKTIIQTINKDTENNYFLCNQKLF